MQFECIQMFKCKFSLIQDFNGGKLRLYKLLWLASPELLAMRFE